MMDVHSFANSSGVPNRFGLATPASRPFLTFSDAASINGVSMIPGAMVMTRIPYRARSRAMGSVIPMTAPCFGVVASMMQVVRRGKCRPSPPTVSTNRGRSCHDRYACYTRSRTLEAEYGTCPFCPSIPATDATLMMTPRLPSASAGSRAMAAAQWDDP